MEKASTNVNAVDRALDIVEFLYENGGSAGINEISKGLNMYKSTVHRLINTLKDRGYIYQNSSNSKYCLGLRFYSIGLMFKENLSILELLRPYAEELSEKYNECVHVSIIDEMSKDCPKQISVFMLNAAKNILSITPVIGTPSRSHCSASGKCLMAFSKKEYIDRFRGCELHKYTEATITDWDVLEHELDIVKKRGYAIDNGELETGLMCVAVPLLNASGEVIAAVSMIGPTVRLNSYNLDDIASDLISITKKAM